MSESKGSEKDANTQAPDFEGYIKLHRDILESRVFQNEALLKVWVYCLCKASFKDRWVTITTGKGKQEINVKPGQFIFGRHKAATALDMSPSTVKKRFDKLQEIGAITIQSNNQYSIVSICKWETYQSENNQRGQRGNNQVTSKEQPSDSQVTQTRMFNNVEESLNNVEHIKEFYNSVCAGLPKIQKLTDKRKKLIKARIEEHGIDKVKEVIDIASKNEFLNGGGNRGWKANIDFLMNANKFIKVLEGVYDSQSKEDNSPKMTEPEYMSMSVAQRKKIKHPVKLWGNQKGEILQCDKAGRPPYKVK